MKKGIRDLFKNVTTTAKNNQVLPSLTIFGGIVYFSPGKRAVLSCSVFKGSLVGNLLSWNTGEIDVFASDTVERESFTIFPCNGAIGWVFNCLFLFIGTFGRIVGFFGLMDETIGTLTFGIVTTGICCGDTGDVGSVIKFWFGGDGGSSLKGTYDWINPSSNQASISSWFNDTGDTFELSACLRKCFKT